MFEEANDWLHRPAVQSSFVTPEPLTQRWTPGLCLLKVYKMVEFHVSSPPTGGLARPNVMKSSHTLGGFRDLFSEVGVVPMKNRAQGRVW